MKLRQDAWEKEHDFLLAELVLKHIKEGSTQLNAFEEAGDQLNRTSAACGFRWNAVIRQQYIEAMELARKERKQRSRLKAQQANETKRLSSRAEEKAQLVDSASFTMKDVIAYLKQFAMAGQPENMQNENNELRAELEKTREENRNLKKELEEVKQVSASIQEDYEALMKIMERARKLVAFSEEPPAPVKFKMERNGNLEKIAE